MWTARVFTLYPEIFPGPLNKGLYGKALKKELWKLEVVNIRDSARDKHKTVDDTPFGGGNGMLLKADILGSSIDKNIKKGERIFYLSPKGRKFNQKIAKEISNEKKKFYCYFVSFFFFLLDLVCVQGQYSFFVVLH